MEFSARPLARKRAVLVLLVAALALALWMSVLAAEAQAKTVRLNGVATTLTTDPGTTSTLFGAGIIPLPIAPSWVAPTTDAAKYRFPITGGRIDSRTHAGVIRHSGGILLVQRDTTANTWTSLSLSRFDIRISGDPHLTAIVNNDARVRIADLDLSDATVKRYWKHHRRHVRIANVGVTLNATATGAIEQTFFGGADVLPDNVKLGDATVVARVAR